PHAKGEAKRVAKNWEKCISTARSAVHLHELPCAAWVRWDFEDPCDLHHCRGCIQNFVDGIPHTYPAREILPGAMAGNLSRSKKRFNLVRQLRRITPQIHRVATSNF